MKSLMIVFSFVCVVLGFAGVSYAAGLKEPIYPPYCWVQPTGSELWYPCGSEEVFVVNCVRLMETAMKAVDPNLQFTETGTKFTPEEKEKYEKALAFWNQTKHDCWKEYSFEREQHLH